MTVHCMVYGTDVRKVHAFIGTIRDALLSSKDGRGAPVSAEVLKWLLEQGRFALLRDPMLVRTTGPINVCGDIHGQYSDLLTIFQRLGYPSKKNRYLFLGDYIDRGTQSIEVFSLLLCYKLLYPRDFYMLRGNHESSEISKVYGFYDECKRRYSVKMWGLFTNVFDCIPVAGAISRKGEAPAILCMHGGLSPFLTKLEDIEKIARPTSIPDSGLLCDLLWSDPDSDKETSPVPRDGWNENDRGVSYVFGEDVVKRFLSANNMDLVCRGHQVVEDGYDFFCGRDLITIFSAPRYCGDFDNKGAVLNLTSDLMCSLSVFD